MNDEVRKGAVIGFAAYVLWGGLTLYWKELHEFDPFELIGYRVVASTVLLVAVLASRRRVGVVIRALRSPAVSWRIVAAALLLTANWTSYVWSITHDRVIEAALGYFIAPLGTMLIGVVVLHERLVPIQRFAIALAATAVVVVTIGYGRVPIIALIIAGSWSGYGLLKRQVPLSPLESLTAETLVLIPPALVLVGWGLTRSDGVVASATPWQGILVALTGVVTAVPLVMFAFAAQRVPFTVLGPMQYAVPVINFLLGWLAYDEKLGGTTLVGFALIWAALAVTTVHTVRSAGASRAHAILAETARLT